MRKIFFIFISILIIYWNNTFAEEWNKSPFSLQSWYSLYKERVKNICDVYKEKKEIVKIADNYLELETGDFNLSKVKRLHRDNMNSIYKCWILSVQEKALLLIKDKLQSWKISKKIESKIRLIKLSFNKLKCIQSKEVNPVLKLNVLKQATYQTCKYVSYLEYLREYNTIIENVLPFRWNTYTISNLKNLQEENENNIDEEIVHTYKVFPLAYHAYTEYENNIIVHYLLELIKDDYILVREKLHEVLNPINQVVYKISNAMSK